MRSFIQQWKFYLSMNLEMTEIVHCDHKTQQILAAAQSEA